MYAIFSNLPIASVSWGRELEAAILDEGVGGRRGAAPGADRAGGRAGRGGQRRALVPGGVVHSADLQSVSQTGQLSYSAQRIWDSLQFWDSRRLCAIFNYFAATISVNPPDCSRTEPQQAGPGPGPGPGSRARFQTSHTKLYIYCYQWRATS